MSVSAQSLAHHLKKIADCKKMSFNEVHLLFALERLIARLKQDPYVSSHLIFKGGYILIRIYDIQRFTRDLDGVGFEQEKKHVLKKIPDLIQADLGDGIHFVDLKQRSIENAGEEKAIRFEFRYKIGDPPKSRSIMKLPKAHLDIAFGGYIDSNERTLSHLLDKDQKISFKVYPPELIFAEKTHALIERGSTNSRARDIFDMVELFPKIDVQSLIDAIKHAFSARGTEIPKSFSKTLNEIDTRILMSAWKSLKNNVGRKLIFEDYWQKLQTYFKEIDQKVKE